MNKREMTRTKCNKLFLKDLWRKMMLQSFKIFVEKVERKGVSRTFVKGCFILPKLCFFAPLPCS
jgi:hypothetical protein